MISSAAGAGRAARRARPPRCLLAPSGTGAPAGWAVPRPGGGSNAPNLAPRAPSARRPVPAVPGISARPPWRGSCRRSEFSSPAPSFAGPGCRGSWSRVSHGSAGCRPRRDGASAEERAGFPGARSAFTPARQSSPVEAESCLVNVADVQRTFHGAHHRRLLANLGCSEVRNRTIFCTG